MADKDEGAGAHCIDNLISPGVMHSTITLDETAFSVEALCAALESGNLETYVLSLPRQDLSLSDKEVVEKFREAAKVYLFR